jgi:hypothetical protein
MRKDLISSDFSLVSGSAIFFAVGLVLLLCLPVAAANQPSETTRTDLHTSRYLGSLGPDQRRLLQDAISRSVRSVSSKDDAAAIPDHQVYHGIFLDILMNPALSAGLPAVDLELIGALPNHADRRFVSVAREAMASACKVIERNETVSPAAVNRAIGGIRQAREKVSDQLDRHYRNVIDRLTEAGQQLVASAYERLIGQDSLVYVELDFDALGFSDPEFVLAFLQDSCANAEPVFAALATEHRTLREQLETDYSAGALQYFQPRR